MLYEIDYEERKRGGRIVIETVQKIAQELEDYCRGYESYGNMLFAIGEKLKIAGCALATENRYADKEYDDTQFGTEDGMEEMDDELEQVLEMLKDFTK